MQHQKKEAYIIYPHQLYTSLLEAPTGTVVYLIEDSLFFKDDQYPLNFHKQKLILHRASLKQFAHALEKKGHTVVYLEWAAYTSCDAVFAVLAAHGITHVNVYDPVDYVLEKRIIASAHSHGIHIVMLECPQFLTTKDTIHTFFAGKKKFLMHSFYVFQRKRLDILMKDGKPEQGKWSFDEDNRKRLPAHMPIPSLPKLNMNPYKTEAIAYVEKHFPHNPGVAACTYPTTYEEAMQYLDDFINERLLQFGPYEDAIAEKEHYLFHSVLSSSLNIGLLLPGEVVDRVLAHKKRIPIQSLEGFIRQIIGWREFMRAVYVIKGVEIRKSNFFGHTRTLREQWYTGDTGIPAVDACIRKVQDTAYIHHIERLMIMGNIFLLSEIKPDDVYRWFMEMCIDAYDWVMVPNVYSMSQFACGGTITTKPYFSSSQYVRNMSDYPKGEWQHVWDSLFYYFWIKNRAFLETNPRIGILTKHLDKKSPQEREMIQKTARNFIESMTV